MHDSTKMLDSTKRALTETCPRCGAEKKIPCLTASPWVHAARRDLFFIETGKKKRKTNAKAAI